MWKESRSPPTIQSCLKHEGCKGAILYITKPLFIENTELFQTEGDYMKRMDKQMQMQNN